MANEGLKLPEAFDAACKALRRKDRPTASMHDAGLVRVNGVGWCQVFVKVCRFDLKLMQEHPETGGLLCEDN